ncbi:hypothetical protein B0H16DRAFT_1428921 [Mycena metata]|uniref:DUF6534 domain-containing protein n=1 Tax=Mycena metata TaxID=1033252 RepID=A0AAD7MQP7_9AGAR|nr:hypothetical protein B0H16DRAFT_1428921 [Mycena metata]
MSSSISFDPTSTIGALQIGVLVSVLLFGITTSQAYFYYSRFPDDSVKLKALVMLIWCCELGHAICIGHGLYTYTISDYGQPERLFGPMPKSIVLAVFFTGVIEPCVQSFFSLRIYRLSKKLYIPALSWILSFVRFTVNMVGAAAALRMKSMPGYLAQWEWLIMADWCISVTNDVAITVTLVFLLYRQRTNAYKRTALLMDKLIAWTIETGMLTSVMSILTLALFVREMESFIWVSVYLVGPRLFSNSLLASLNSRATLRALNEAPLNLTAAISMTSDSAQIRCTKGQKVTRDEEVSA